MSAACCSLLGSDHRWRHGFLFANGVEIQPPCLIDKIASAFWIWNRKQMTMKNTIKISGRGDRIRTCDIYVPNVALYQSELHPGYRTRMPDYPDSLAEQRIRSVTNRRRASVRG